MKIKARLVYVPDLLPGEELFQEILDPFTLIPHHIDFRMGLFQGIFRSLMYDFELFVDVMQCRLSYQYLAFTFLPNMLTSLLQVHVLVVLELQYIFLFHPFQKSRGYLANSAWMNGVTHAVMITFEINIALTYLSNGLSLRSDLICDILICNVFLGF